MLLQFSITADLDVLMTDTSWGLRRPAGGLELPRGQDLSCLLFCSSALTPAERCLSNPLSHSGSIQCQDPTPSHSAVRFLAVIDRLCFCYSEKKKKAASRSLSHGWLVFRACPLIVIQWNRHELLSVTLTANWGLISFFFKKLAAM